MRPILLKGHRRLQIIGISFSENEMVWLWALLKVMLKELKVSCSPLIKLLRLSFSAIRIIVCDLSQTSPISALHLLVQVFSSTVLIL